MRRPDPEIIAELQRIFARREDEPGDNLTQARIYLHGEDIRDPQDQERYLRLAQRA